MVHYIRIDKKFDIGTLYVIMRNDNSEIKKLIQRNTHYFYTAHTVEYAEDTKTLSDMTAEYEDNLREKIEVAKLRLASTTSGQSIGFSEASAIFKRTIRAVENELKAIEADSFFVGELGDKIEDDFEQQKDESLNHLSMFIGQYTSDLDVSDENYMKKYIHTMINHGYLFEKNNQTFSLLVFLSFYEAYIKRIIGLALLDFAKGNRRFLNAQAKSDDVATYEQAKHILKYVNNTKTPQAKSCYFKDLQKWYKGEISEFIECFMIAPVDEIHKIEYQKATLIDKKMLKLNKCDEVLEPPVTISSPPLIEDFSLLQDSHYILM
jgi:hypothetical protein